MNSLAKCVVALVLAFALIGTLNLYIVLGVLVVELITVPVLGLPARRLARILWPISVAAFLAALTTALYGRTSGHVFFEWGPVIISEGSLLLALTVGARVLAIGLPGVALFATIDPTDFADSLAQLWKLPQRFVFGALAAIRLLDVLVEDWRMLSLARRARGLGSGHGPVAAVIRTSSQVFALLVSALRRGATLAIAMDARGFGAPAQRTYAREASWSARDSWVVVAAALLGVAIVAASMMLGDGMANV